jgi:5-methylcytosine-specific restriction endonuclease McrA
MSRSNNRRWNEFRARVISREQHRLGSKYLRCALCHRTDLDPKAPPHTERSIELDHKQSVANGGAEYPGMDGVQVLCHPCNRKKSNRDDWRPGNESSSTKPQPEVDAVLALRVGWYSLRNHVESGLPVPVSQPWFGDERYFDGDDWHAAPAGGWPVETTRPRDVE